MDGHKPIAPSGYSPLKEFNKIRRGWQKQKPNGELRDFFSDKFGVSWDEVLIVLRAIDDRHLFHPSDWLVLDEIVRRMWKEIKTSRKNVNQEAKDSFVPRDEPRATSELSEVVLPCPWCGAFVDREDEWGSIIIHKPSCYWKNISDTIGGSSGVRVCNSEKAAWNTRADLVAAPQGLAVSSRQREVWDAAIEIVNQLHLAPQFAGHYHNGFEMAKSGAIRRLAEARNATPASGYDQRTIEACAQIAERHSCTHASGYRCYEGDKIAKTIRALAITPVHEGENCERA